MNFHNTDLTGKREALEKKTEKTTPSFAATKKDFREFCRLLHDRRLVAGVGGNVAARSGKRIFLTPTGCSLREIRPERISVVDGEGNRLQGDPPTTEAQVHMEILRARPEINVVAHLHGAYIIAVSTLLTPGPNTLPPLTPGFVYHAYPLPMIPFMVPGTKALSSAASTALALKKGAALLLQNHGLITTGKDFSETLNIAEEIDEAARIYLLTRGRATQISDDDIAKIKAL